LKLSTKLQRNYDKVEADRIATANNNRAIETKRVDDQSAAMTADYSGRLEGIGQELEQAITDGNIPSITIADEAFAICVNEAVAPLKIVVGQQVWDDFVAKYKDLGIAVVVAQGKRRNGTKKFDAFSIISLRAI
jgi:hypothetical protein